MKRLLASFLGFFFAFGIVALVPQVGGANSCNVRRSTFTVRQQPIKRIVINDNHHNNEIVTIREKIIEIPAFRFKYDPEPYQRLDEETVRRIIREELQEAIKDNPTNEENPDDDIPMARNPNEIVTRAPVDTNYIESKALDILKTNCAACHTGTSSKGEFVIFADTRRIVDGLDRLEIYEQVKDGKMPLAARKDPSKKLSASDVDVMKQWAKKIYKQKEKQS